MESKEKKISSRSDDKKQENNLLKTSRTDDSTEKFSNKDNGKVFMTYRIDKKSLEETESKYDKFIQIFGYDFVKKNKDNCKMIISGKEYAILANINVEEFDYYGINN